jgi:hypothetical protein
VRPSRRARIGVNEVLAEESRTRARGARDAPPAPTNGAPSGDARFALLRLVAVLLGAGLGALGGAALDDRSTGVALGVAAGFTLPALLEQTMGTGRPRRNP